LLSFRFIGGGVSQQAPSRLRKLLEFEGRVNARALTPGNRSIYCHSGPPVFLTQMVGWRYIPHQESKGGITMREEIEAALCSEHPI
jgi:hypothetical protein